MAHTYLTYERDVNRALISHLGNSLLGDLNAVRGEAKYAAMLKAGLSAEMVRKAATTPGVTVHAAVKKRLLPSNPARDADRPAVPLAASTALKVLEPARVGRFLDAAPEDRYFALLALWLDSGARERELFGLHWTRVDWKRQAVTNIRKPEDVNGRLRLKELKTPKSRRRIAVRPLAFGALAKHRRAEAHRGARREGGAGVHGYTGGAPCGRATSSGGPSTRFWFAPACRTFGPTTCGIPARRCFC